MSQLANFLKLQAASLQERSGQLQLAHATLKDAAERNPDGPGAERIQQRLDEINAEIAKQPVAK